MIAIRGRLLGMLLGEAMGALKPVGARSHRPGGG
jgi:hypothetical protein